MLVLCRMILGRLFGRIDWVPVDLLAGVLVHLVLEQVPASGTVGIFHLLNPWPTAWEVIRFVVAGVLGWFAGKEVDMVSLFALGATHASECEVVDQTDVPLQELLEANPAVKLLSFFEDVVASAGGVPDNVLEI